MMGMWWTLGWWCPRHVPCVGEGRSCSRRPDHLVHGEIVVLKKLKHKHIVKLYEVLDDPSQDSLYMVFELCEEGR
ncbi:hypothetical protein BJ742DRAFT_796511 [Cladochytrium replicatum]|nr:hypothetical protein BJ742DRAFT_796511 [Cladochytrium replicatum]